MQGHLSYFIPMPPFDPQLESELSGWADPGARLRRALEQEEFRLYCQPIRALSATEPYPMAELLVRLREEEEALLPPGDFFPVFESHGMMPDLDLWVVRRALRWLAEGSKIPSFAINVSWQSLEAPGFASSVVGALADSGLSATALLFEISEEDSLVRIDAAQRFSSAVKRAGCRVVIDGFGARSTTFAALSALQADFVKVDGSIVRKLLTSDVARTKFNAILRVCGAVGVGVIAEHVEEQDVLVRLRALGTGFVQGFGVYQPHPLESFAAGAVLDQPR